MEETEIIPLAIKSYMKHLVAQTNAYPSFYKYCSFEGGLNMLKAMNIQFTRADSLNDEYEVNLSKSDFDSYMQLLRDVEIPDEIIAKKTSEAKSFFNGIGICSCGKSPHNMKLWEDYASSPEYGENGICIELNQKLVIDYLLGHNIKAIALKVNYFDNVSEFLPWDLFLGNDLQKNIFLQLLYSSKLKSKWAKEDEVRFIYSEPFEGTYFRPSISPKCITSVYFGRDMPNFQRIKIGGIINNASSG